jgi:hypothetical protein
MDGALNYYPTNGYSGVLFCMPIAPGMNTFVLGQLLDDQFFPNACTTSRAALAGNEGSNEVRPLEGSLRATGAALEHELLWAPPVDPLNVPRLPSFVVGRDALDDLHRPLLSQNLRALILLTGFIHLSNGY